MIKMENPEKFCPFTQGNICYTSCVFYRLRRRVIDPEFMNLADHITFRGQVDEDNCIEFTECLLEKAAEKIAKEPG